MAPEQQDYASRSSAFEDESQAHAVAHIQEHIELIAKHEQEFLAKRTRTERFADRMASFIGSLPYVVAHIGIFTLWILWNTLPFDSLPHFDPFPFPFLDFIFAFEAILVVSFILMRQSRIGRRQEERDQLMLQIMLLSEREITAVLGINREIAARMGLHKVAANEEITQLSEQTSIEDVAQVIRESLPTE